MRRGEVYWVRFPSRVGGMIRKARPAVVVTSDAAIPHLNRVQVVPLTSHTHRRYRGKALVTVGTRASKALATQVTTVDKSLIDDHYAALSTADLAEVDRALRQQLGL